MTRYDDGDHGDDDGNFDFDGVIGTHNLALDEKSPLTVNFNLNLCPDE